MSKYNLRKTASREETPKCLKTTKTTKTKTKPKPEQPSAPLYKKVGQVSWCMDKLNAPKFDFLGVDLSTLRHITTDVDSFALNIDDSFFPTIVVSFDGNIEFNYETVDDKGKVTRHNRVVSKKLHYDFDANKMAETHKIFIKETEGDLPDIQKLRTQLLATYKLLKML